MTKKILLLVATTALMVLMLAPVAWASGHMAQGGQLPASGGLPILPIVGAAAATLVLAGGGIAYWRRGR